MQIIGLGAYSRVGKDSLANSIIASLEEYQPGIRVRKIPFAWKLKQQAAELYGWDGLQGPEFYDIKENEYLRDVKLPTIGKTPVEIWVEYGMWAREIYESTWIDYVLKTDHGLDVLIIPDVRFPNEIAALREADAYSIIKVVRPGFGPRKTVADRALMGCTDWDLVVGASGEMQELRRWGSRLAHGILTDRKIEQSSAEYHQALTVEVIEPWTPPVPAAKGFAVTVEFAKKILDLNTFKSVHGGGSSLTGDELEKLTALAWQPLKVAA